MIADKIIDHIETVHFKSICGQDFFETRTTLKTKHQARPEYDFYGNIDGTGTSKSRLVSQLKSISESLERLAFYTHQADDKYGFHQEKTTTGMAAIPKLFSDKAPTLARYEAIERWAVIEWWNGKLRTTEIKQYGAISYFQIEVPFTDCAVVIAFIKSNDRTAYGFASSSTPKRALIKAITELDRNTFVLSRIKDEQARQTDELRLHYFSKDCGFKHFIDVHRNSLDQKKVVSNPLCIFDGEIRGVWNKYACVWRVLYEYSSYDFLNPKNDFFIF